MLVSYCGCGCFPRLAGSICSPCSTSALGISHLSWRLCRRSPCPARAVPDSAELLSTSTRSPKLNLLQTGPGELLLYTESPLQSQEQTGALFSGEECLSPRAALEGAGAAPQGAPHPFGSQLLCRAPLRPGRWLWPGCSRAPPGLVSAAS